MKFIIAAIVVALFAVSLPVFAGGPPQMLVSIDTGATWPGGQTRWNVAWACMGALAAEEPFDLSQQAGHTYVAYDNSGVKYTGLNLSPAPSLSWTGHIWSDANELRDTVYVKFQVGDPYHQYRWGLQIFYPDGTPFTSSAFNGSEYSATMPTIAVSDWRNGLTFNVSAAAVPEPSSMLVLGTSLLGLGGLVARRRK